MNFWSHLHLTPPSPSFPIPDNFLSLSLSPLPLSALNSEKVYVFRQLKTKLRLASRLVMNPHDWGTKGTPEIEQCIAFNKLRPIDIGIEGLKRKLYQLSPLSIKGPQDG